MFFRFRLRWRLEHGQTFEGLAQPALVSLSPEVYNCVLKCVGDESAAGGQDLALRSGVFMSRSEAEMAARAVLASLVLLSVRRGFGVSLVPRTPPPHITDYGIEWFADQMGFNGPLKRDAYGLTIYHEAGNTQFVKGGDLSPRISTSLGNIVADWQACMQTADVIDERILLSYDLYASSRFENSSRARFLMLIMSIEALLERSFRSDDECQMISSMVSMLEHSTLSPNQISSLKTVIEPLKYRSIGSSARSLLKRAVRASIVTDGEPVNFFMECYDIRSRMVHEGIAVDLGELSNRSNRLDNMIRELLAALLEDRFSYHV